MRTTAAILAAACAWGQASEEETRLARLIEPRDAQESGAVDVAEEEFETLVRALVETSQWDAIKSLGEAAGPVLSAMASEMTLMEVLSRSQANLMPWLIETAPLAALDYHEEILRTLPLRFEALTRSGNSFTTLFEGRFLSRGLGEGAPREKLLGLLDGALLNQSFTLDVRVRMACRAAESGYLTPASGALLRENVELAIQAGDASSFLEVLVPPREPVPVSAPLSLVQLVIGDRYTTETFQRLAGSPHAEVRRYIARGMDEFVRSARFEAEGGIAPLLEGLGVDKVLAVRESACISAVEILRDLNLRLDPADVTALALVALRSGVLERGYSGQLKTALVDRWRSRAGFTREHVRAVVAFVASMESPAVRMEWSQSGISFDSAIEAAFGAFDGAKGGPAEFYARMEESLVDALGRSRWVNADLADGTLEFFLRAKGDHAEESRRAALLLKARGQGTRTDGRYSNVAATAVFAGLSPEKVPDAIAWMASTKTALGQDAQESVKHWTEAEAPLRAVFGETSRSWEERSIAAAGLLNIGRCSLTDRAAIMRVLLSNLQGADGLERTKEFFGQVAMDASRAATWSWSELSAELLENSAFPNDVAVMLPLLLEGSTPEELGVVRRVLDAATARLVASEGNLGFANMAYRGLDAMAAHPSLVRKKLLMGWVLAGNLGESTVRAAVASGDAEILRQVQAGLKSVLQSSNRWDQMQRYADLMFMLPGNEPVEDVLEVALQSDAKPFTDYVDERVANRMRLRRAAAEWGQLGAMASTKEASIARLIKLLEAPNKDVRLAAIQGLGTMGAIVAVPDLVELVASEDEAVKAAALDALERLKQTKKD